MEDSDQLERIRAKAYAIVESDPGGPNADQARRILSKLPKTQVGMDRTQRAGYHKRVDYGELPSGGDFGAALPPTPDEEAGLPSELAQPSLGQRAAAAMLSPSTRREFERGLDRMLTGGLGNKAARKVGEAIGDESFSEQQARADAGESPNANMAGQIIAALSGKGLVGGAAKVGTMAMRPLANAGRGLLGRTLAGAVAGAGANEIAMPLIAGAQKAVDLENPLPAMREELTNPVNAISGAAMGAPSGLARGIRDTGQAGRDIRLVEEHGASATPMGPRGGIFEAPIMRDVEGTARSQGGMSRTIADKVMEGIDEERRALHGQYATDKAAARNAGYLEGKIDPQFVRDEADRLIGGAGLTSGERASIQREVLDELDKYPGGMSVDQFNDFRGKLGRIFGVGPGETSVPAIDKLRQAAKRTVDETEMGPINDRYSKGRERIDRMHQQLGISEEGRPDRQARSLANTIQQRTGQEASAGIRETGDLGVNQFLAENPKYRQLFDLPELLAAKERMTLGIEPEAGFHRRIGHTILHKNLEPALVGAYRLGRPMERGSVPAALAAQFLLREGIQ